MRDNVNRPPVADASVSLCVAFIYPEKYTHLLYLRKAY